MHKGNNGGPKRGDVLASRKRRAHPRDSRRTELLKVRSSSRKVLKEIERLELEDYDEPECNDDMLDPLVLQVIAGLERGEEVSIGSVE
jgi:hypothetical protein